VEKSDTIGSESRTGEQASSEGGEKKGLYLLLVQRERRRARRRMSKGKSASVNKIRPCFEARGKGEGGTALMYKKTLAAFVIGERKGYSHIITLGRGRRSVA